MFSERRKSLLIVGKVILALTLITSCNFEKSLEGELVNLYGGGARDNSFERFGDFYRELYVIDTVESKKDKGVIAPLLSLSSFKTVYPCADGSISLIDEEILKWTAQLDSSFVVAAGMAADKKQNIYAIDNDGKLYSFSKNGDLRWKKRHTKVGENITVFSDLLALNDGIIAASTDGVIAMYSFEGERLWGMNKDMSILSYFPSYNGENVVLPLTHNLYGETDTLLYINSKGEEIWRKSFEGARIVKPPIINSKRIYFSGVEYKGGEKFPALYALDLSGELIWKKGFAQMPRFISAAENGDLYVVAYNSGFGTPISQIIKLNKKGEKIWDKSFEAAVPSPVMIGENEISFCGASDAAYGLFFLSKRGDVRRMMSLSEAPPLRLRPAASPGPNILFPLTERFGVLRLDETPMNKVIPW